MQTVRLTMAQALVRFLDNQVLEADGAEQKFVQGVFAIFGHGNVVGLGEALAETSHSLRFHQGHNEQGMAHAAVAFAKQRRRRQIYAVTSSIGPGAMNMVTAAATATVNRIPVLLLPGDVFACRQPDPVLQQLEQPADLSITANDAFKAVSRYWDRITRPEQLMTAALNAMRVLTDPAETGAVTLALPQDVQGEAFDYPVEFLERRVHHLERRAPDPQAIRRAADLVTRSSRPLLICGGGVRYADAGQALDSFCRELGVPFAETQAGKGVLAWDHPFNLGGIGVTGNLAANRMARDADLVIAVGTRLGDFTTGSKRGFGPNATVVAINVCRFDALKMNAAAVTADARPALEALRTELAARGYRSGYHGEVERVREEWRRECDRLYGTDDPAGLSQTRALGLLNEELLAPEAIVVGSSGSLPGDMQRVWRPRRPDGYHVEYGFSCMGYEVCGALGARLAEPDREVYAMVGDGSYVMLHSELLSSVKEGVKINVLLFDNGGYQCIDNLQTSQGIRSFGTEFRFRNSRTGELDGEYVPVDYAANAAAYGVKTYTARTVEELRAAVKDARSQSRSTLIDIKVTAKSMTGGYESWWRVGTPEVSERQSVRSAHESMSDAVEQARRF